jgi:hypothetical protein
MNPHLDSAVHTRPRGWSPVKGHRDWSSEKRTVSNGSHVFAVLAYVRRTKIATGEIAS